jgi:carbon storage regulator CsrA
LSRKANEGIRIGPVLVMCVEVRGDKVRLGFQAPRSIPVVRTELESDEPFSPRQYVKDSLSMLAEQLGRTGIESQIDRIVDDVVRLMEPSACPSNS